MTTEEQRNELNEESSRVFTKFTVLEGLLSLGIETVMQLLAIWALYNNLNQVDFVQGNIINSMYLDVNENASYVLRSGLSDEQATIPISNDLHTAFFYWLKNNVKK